MSNAVVAKRQTNIDLLRIAACFLVILLHVSAAYWGWGDIYQTGWTGIAGYVNVTRCCVPLFLMISGKLFLERKNAVPIPKLLTNYVLKLVVLYVVWGLFYAVDELGVHVLLSGNWMEVLKCFLTTPAFHLWYLPMQTGIYLMIPVFWALAKYENGKYLGYTCVLTCAFGVLYDTVMLFISGENYVCAFLDNYGTFLSVNCAYFLMGYYFSTKKLDKLKVWHCLLIYTGAVAVAAIYTIRASRLSGACDSKLLENYPITTVVATIAMFLAFLKMPCNFSQRTGKIIAVVSRCTLFIYLIHPVVQDRLDWLGINAFMFNPWIAAPVVAAIIFVICLIPALVLTKIPVVNKWLL